MDKKKLNISRAILIGFVNGIVLHAIMSGIWILGFMFAMSAFNPKPNDISAEPFFMIHNIFYFPIIAAEYYGIHLTPGATIEEDFVSTLQFAGIGPYPCLATIIWCMIMGVVFYVIVQLFKRCLQKK